MVGGTVVIMHKFRAELALRLIERWQIQSTFLPPVLLKRLLDLPENVRRKYDTSSLKNISVGGAPCPNPVRGRTCTTRRCCGVTLRPCAGVLAAAGGPGQVKEATARAFGNVLYEFYGSSEMGINTILRPEVCARARPTPAAILQAGLTRWDPRSRPARTTSGRPAQAGLVRQGRAGRGAGCV